MLIKVFHPLDLELEYDVGGPLVVSGEMMMECAEKRGRIFGRNQICAPLEMAPVWFHGFPQGAAVAGAPSSNAGSADLSDSTAHSQIDGFLVLECELYVTALGEKSREERAHPSTWFKVGKDGVRDEMG